MSIQLQFGIRTTMLDPPIFIFHKEHLFVDSIEPFWSIFDLQIVTMNPSNTFSIHVHFIMILSIDHSVLNFNSTAPFYIQNSHGKWNPCSSCTFGLNFPTKFISFFLWSLLQS